MIEVGIRMGDQGEPIAEIDIETPHAARIWNYWMGGQDNYPSDRAAGDAVAAVYPDIVRMARLSREFLIQVVSYLAGVAGIRQFIDVGTGLPTMQNTHEVAQHIAPESRIVYVDNDPLVLAHARALLTNTSPEGLTTYFPADYHDPDLILEQAARVLDLSRPTAVLLMGVMGYEPDLAVVRDIVGRLMAPMSTDSHLVLWDGTATGDAVEQGGRKLVEAGGAPYILRSPEQLAGCFEGLEMVEPGMVRITDWRPVRRIGTTEPLDAYGAVARKP
ncbi:SAM-dependent methyltransferase [Nocardia jiangxiensis]|uniref:SAM-dependent methyltransferase n=1 Tax=Nocardia jiangxiensis TaxID=282685 RepID=A0ABW6RVA8_9NOCA|nr:SAM-dependent methyltransferase [Nocardia jiangxiensis]